MSLSSPSTPRVEFGTNAGDRGVDCHSNRQVRAVHLVGKQISVVDYQRIDGHLAAAQLIARRFVTL